MSPEQCDGESAAIDTRTDIYSLGVVLYELLTGTAPYGESGTTIYKAIRAIKETPPRRPSELNRRLRGDLDAILLKALEKDPARRYGSAADLAQDLRRHLAGEPIEARPPTFVTKAVRWALRHPFALTAVVCVGLILATALSTYLTYHAVAREPDHFEWADNQRVLRLKSAGGLILRTWKTSAPYRVVQFQELIERPQALGGGRLAVLGFSGRNPDPPYSGVAFYDAYARSGEPLMTLNLSDDDIPPHLFERDDADVRSFADSAFGVEAALLADVFDDPPGVAADELIVIFQHPEVTQAALSIYRLDGELLYRVWMDADVRSFVWLPESEVLVLGGNNGVAHLRDRQIPADELPSRASVHPIVVFAIRPEQGFITREYLAQEIADRDTAPPQLTPVWYYMLHPVRLYERVLWEPEYLLTEADRAAIHSDAVRVNIGVKPLQPLPNEDTMRTWLIEGNGSCHDVPFGNVWDTFGATADDPDRPLPGHDEFYLGDLPPLKEAGGRSAAP
jgi:hypothetical protein